MEKLMTNVSLFRELLSRMGFSIGDGMTPIVPIIIGEAQ